MKRIDNTIRGQEWLDFSEEVFDHIKNYSIPQYGDAPNDNVSEWTAEDCVKQIEKYAKRFGKNAREGQDEIDLKKIAHYACLAFGKMED